MLFFPFPLSRELKRIVIRAAREPRTAIRGKETGECVKRESGATTPGSCHRRRSSTLGAQLAAHLPSLALPRGALFLFRLCEIGLWAMFARSSDRRCGRMVESERKTGRRECIDCQLADERSMLARFLYLYPLSLSPPSLFSLSVCASHSRALFPLLSTDLEQKAAHK